MDTRLRDAFRFMLANAGYATPPGRAACALSLARAELDATAKGYRFQWHRDDDVRTTATDEQVARIEAGETCYLWCACYSPDGEVVASLSGIEVTDEGDTYCRVVEAELASEALHEATAA